MFIAAVLALSATLSAPSGLAASLQPAPADLTPLCIVALGTAEPADVTSCVLRLESLRLILPPIGTGK